RLFFRNMLSQSGERTLIPAIFPKGVANIHPVQCAVIRYEQDLVAAAGITFSLVGDFFVKATGKAMLYGAWTQLPYVDSSAIRLRTLASSCLITHYADLWQSCWQPEFQQDSWASADPRLPQDFFAQLTPDWQRHNALRSDYARRQALVE